MYTQVCSPLQMLPLGPEAAEWCGQKASSCRMAAAAGLEEWWWRWCLLCGFAEHSVDVCPGLQAMCFVRAQLRSAPNTIPLLNQESAVSDSFLASESQTVSLVHSPFSAWTQGGWQRTWRAEGWKRQSLSIRVCAGHSRRLLAGRGCRLSRQLPRSQALLLIRQAQCIALNCLDSCCCLSTQKEITAAGMSGQPTLLLTGEGPKPVIVRATSCRGGGNPLQTLAKPMGTDSPQLTFDLHPTGTAQERPGMEPLLHSLQA